MTNPVTVLSGQDSHIFCFNFSVETVGDQTNPAVGVWDRDATLRTAMFAEHTGIKVSRHQVLPRILKKILFLGLV